MKKIVLTSLLSLFSLFTFAQQTSSETQFLPEKGDFLVSLLLGRGQYPNQITAPSSNTGTIVNENPDTGVINSNANSLVNMIGAEVRYFLKDNLALKFSGGVIMTNTPGRDNIDGVSGSIPSINSVNAVETINLNLSLGAEYHFKVDSRRLSPYLGVAVPFYYGRNSNYDPGITNGSVNDLYGTRHAVLLGVGTQSYAGVDYYINQDIYFGFQINALGYSYVYSQESSGEGFDISEADTHGFNFLTQPVVKFGFKF